MKKFFGRYENIVLLLALFVVSFALLAKNAGGKPKPNMLEKVALAVSTPIQKGITGSIRHVVGLWSHYIYLVGTSQKNVRLLKKMREQQFQNMLLKEELKRYRRIEDLLSFDQAGKGDFQVAGVVGWDSTNIAHTLVIDRGTKERIKEGMVVITHQGLIGRVVTSSKHSSRVLLITDSRSAVDAILQETRVRCIVVGQNKNTAIIRYLPIDAKVKIGDLLISSGLGEVFPKGLPIGKVSSIEIGDNRLFVKAELIPLADIESVEEVLVMMPPPKPVATELEGKQQ